MMLREHVNELLREVFGDIRVAVGHVGYEIDQFPQRDKSSIVGRRGRCHENLAVTLILVVLSAEIFDIRSEAKAWLLAYCNKEQSILKLGEQLTSDPA